MSPSTIITSSGLHDDVAAALRSLAWSDEAPKSNGRPNFWQARDSWRDHWQADSQLTHADRTVVTQMFRHFNRKHYERTYELQAFPKWETMGKAGHLSKATIFRALRKLERLGALEIEHGRYNHETKKRARNVYRVVRPRFQIETDQGFRIKQYFLDSDSLKEESAPPAAARRPSKQKAKKKSASFEKASASAWKAASAPKGPPASAPKGPPPGSARPPSPKLDRWRRERADDEATLERYAAAAGGGDR